MIHRPKIRAVLPLLALGVTLAMAAPIQAQERRHDGSSGTSVTFEVNLRSAPQWVIIRGTTVREIREGERPDYDLFRCGAKYYVYDNDRWYMSRRWRGRFVAIDDRLVPADLHRVPREHWRHFPSRWEERRTGEPAGTSATLQVIFRSGPHWAGVRGTRVEEVPVAERPDYDVFRYGGGYYAYHDDRWYMSHRESGEFTMIEDRSVPGELFKVPREHWRHYPAAWQNQKGTPPGLAKKGGVPPGQEKKNRESRDQRDHH